METTEKNVAQTILAQLGGHKFQAMTGASNFIDGGNHLTFKFKGSQKTNICMICLNDLDLYNVYFYKLRMGINSGQALIAKSMNIYSNQLQEVFRNTTGLDTHL